MRSNQTWLLVRKGYSVPLKVVEKRSTKERIVRKDIRGCENTAQYMFPGMNRKSALCQTHQGGYRKAYASSHLYL